MKSKKAKTSEEAKDLRIEFSDVPSGCVQWKGTDVCMDVYCKCNCHFHIDDYFAYHVKCPKCGTVYYCNPNIELIEIEEEPDSCVVTENNYEDDDR